MSTAEVRAAHGDTWEPIWATLMAAAPFVTHRQVLQIRMREEWKSALAC